jgi:hypothetical protein
MRLVNAASSVARVPVFFLERGLSAAAAAARLAGRVADRRGAPPPERVWPPAETVESKPPEPPAPAVHVSEEPVLVAEFGEDGAEDGAGPELRIDEPWEGYGSMTAAEIRRRLREADAATVAAVRLYEAANKGRSTVLQAASATPSG